MVEIGKLLLNWILALWKGRADLALENLALRHQVLILERGCKKPRATEIDRLIWIVLSKVWGRWQEALDVFQPRTVVGWSRKVFSRWWAWISRAKGGRPKIERETVELIRQMWIENPTWGAPRIRRELLKLGIQVSQSTVQKYRPRWKGPRDQKWTTFLRNHLDSVAAVDFFTVPTVTCRMLYVFVVLHHDRRRVLHFNVTDSPGAFWTGQQMVEAFPFVSPPKYLLRDNDCIYGEQFSRRVAALGMEEKRTAIRSPWQSPYVERLIGTIRRECLDHFMIFNEGQLYRILARYFEYYNRIRPHKSLEDDSPAGRPVEEEGKVVRKPILGGLHHQYLRTAA